MLIGHRLNMYRYTLCIGNQSDSLRSIRSSKKQRHIRFLRSRVPSVVVERTPPRASALIDPNPTRWTARGRTSSAPSAAGTMRTSEVRRAPLTKLETPLSRVHSSVTLLDLKCALARPVSPYERWLPLYVPVHSMHCARSIWACGYPPVCVAGTPLRSQMKGAS